MRAKVHKQGFGSDTQASFRLRHTSKLSAQTRALVNGRWWQGAGRLRIAWASLQGAAGPRAVLLCNVMLWASLQGRPSK